MNNSPGKKMRLHRPGPFVHMQIFKPYILAQLKRALIYTAFPGDLKFFTLLGPSQCPFQWCPQAFSYLKTLYTMQPCGCVLVVLCPVIFCLHTEVLRHSTVSTGTYVRTCHILIIFIFIPTTLYACLNVILLGSSQVQLNILVAT